MDGSNLYGVPTRAQDVFSDCGIRLSVYRLSRVNFFTKKGRTTGPPCNRRLSTCRD